LDLKESLGAIGPEQEENTSLLVVNNETKLVVLPYKQRATTTTTMMMMMMMPYDAFYLVPMVRTHRCYFSGTTVLKGR
jgi:phosphoketolase